MAGLRDSLEEVERLIFAGEGESAFTQLREQLGAAGRKAFEYDAAGRFLAAWPNESANDLPRLSVGLLGGYTTEPLANAVRCAACLAGMWADVYEAPFQAFRQEILDPASGLYRDRRDLVILAVHAANIQHWSVPEGVAQEEHNLSQEVRDFHVLWTALDERLGCPILQHTLEPLGRHFIGPAEADWPGSPDALIIALNAQLRRSAPRDVHWLDTAAVASRVGIENWCDRRLYFHGKYGFHPRYLDRYVFLVFGLLRALCGQAKKCFVLDLDNTLWGGVVGDDGLDGLQLGSVSAVGEAYADFCNYLKQLSGRGVILAVCSKNEPSLAREVFDRHPEMPLDLDDFAVFHCSWGDKVTGLQAVAQDLNISVDHLVFADDNPAECELVRQQLPGVGVVELRGDPSGFVDLVESGHWFDAVRVSTEDRQRAISYQARRKAEKARQEKPDLPSYLRSLEMVAECGPATLTDLPRLAQMEVKTNQFNLTTRRYDEKTLAELLDRPDRLILGCRLRDRFGEHGLVSSVVLAREGDAWRIDSWLMSCRVFARTLEEHMLNIIVECVRSVGGSRLVGEYRPTERNGVVRDLYHRLGFQCLSVEEESSKWVLELIEWKARVTYVCTSDSAGKDGTQDG